MLGQSLEAALPILGERLALSERELSSLHSQLEGGDASSDSYCYPS